MHATCLDLRPSQLRRSLCGGEDTDKADELDIIAWAWECFTVYIRIYDWRRLHRCPPYCVTPERTRCVLALTSSTDASLSYTSGTSLRGDT